MQFQGIGLRAVAITPDDEDLIGQTIGLYVGGAGNVTVNTALDPDTAVTFVGVPVGTWMPISVVRVKATDTTATNIVALFS